MNSNLISQPKKHHPLIVSAVLILTVVSGILFHPPTAQAGPTYTTTEAQENMRDWLVLGPIEIVAAGEIADEATQRRAFESSQSSAIENEADGTPDRDSRVAIAGKEIVWRLHRSEENTIDLDQIYGRANYAIAYAVAEIDAKEARNMLLAVGSDDGIRVWLNGELAHENWILRPVTQDEDLVPLALRKGVNRVLLKIQDVEGEWGFSCRLLGPQQFKRKLSSAVARGDLERVKLLVENGADLNARDRHGVTPFELATIRGYGKVADYLVARGASRSLTPPSGDEFTQSLLQRIVKKQSPGVAVLVSKDGKILFKNGYGLADREREKKIQPDTKFRIGSVSKQFTATAILKLQEQGKLSVNDKLTKHLPDFPRGDDVTLRQLLTHTSGMHSYTGKPDFMSKVESPVKPEELINYFKDDPFDFEPGERWSYCNSGYFLLGHIVSKVSGKSLDAFLQSEFFQPLGMNDTGIYRNDAPPEGEAFGYSFEDGVLKRATNWDMSWAGGAGALYSTVGDLNRWNEALFSGKVLSQSTLESAFTKAKTSDGKETNYGYGWMIAEHRGLKTIGHGGGLHGFLSQLTRYPDANLTVVVFANASPPAPDLAPSQIAQTIGEFFLWRDMEPRETFETDESVTEGGVEDYVGRYDYGGPIMIVTSQGKRLFAQLTGQPRIEIFPKSKDEFFWKIVEARVKFVRDEKGTVVRAVHYQNGGEIKAPKLSEENVVRVDPEVLKTYAGQYNYGPATMTITVVENRLYAQLTGQPRFEIYPKSKNTFFWKVVQAEVTFVKGTDGLIEKAHHKQGGQEFDALRIE